MEEIDEKTLILEDRHHFLTMYTWDVFNVNANQMKQLLNNVRRCMNHVIFGRATENYRSEKNLMQRRLCGPTKWKDIVQNALSDTVNWQTRKWSNFTKFQVLAWMTINSKRRSLKQLESYQKYDRKLCRHACIWHELVNLTFYGV